MVLRLIEMVLPRGYRVEVEELLQDYHIIEILNLEMSSDLIMFKILVTTEDSESVLDDLEEHFSNLKGFRIFILPVQASIPRINEYPGEGNVFETSDENSDRKERISREELYDKVFSLSKPSNVFLVMMILSSFVASIGVLNNNVAVIIGAMVIAPLLGPNMGLSLATVLKDRDLARISITSIMIGIAIAIVVSFIIGVIVNFDPSITAITLRTDVAVGTIFLAFASGIAGSVAFTSDISSALIGVMVAVALLPPLVVFGLLLGSGDYYLATGALLLFLVNMVCINLSGLLTFTIQKIRPIKKEETIKSYKLTYLSIGVWVVILIILLILIRIRNII